jgi:anti-sigma regulatory factor (Ser/Thr protein kinase)
MPPSSRHEALPYAGAADFVPRCLGAVVGGLALSHRMIVLATAERVAAVEDALGDRSEHVAFVATDEHGRNPARMASLLESFRVSGNGRRPHGVVDWSLPGRTPAAVAETTLAENLLNVAGDRALDVSCLYERGGPQDGDMRASHPFVQGEAANSDYRSDGATGLFAGTLPPTPPDAVARSVGPQELASVRALVGAFARRHGVVVPRAEDFVLAVNEIVTNSLRYADGRCDLSLWPEGRSVVCEVADTGHITDPFVGRAAPAPTATSGRGVWLANQLCDLLQVRSSPAGTRVRMFVDQ